MGRGAHGGGQGAPGGRVLFSVEPLRPRQPGGARGGERLRELPKGGEGGRAEGGPNCSPRCGSPTEVRRNTPSSASAGPTEGRQTRWSRRKQVPRVKVVSPPEGARKTPDSGVLPSQPGARLCQKADRERGRERRNLLFRG